MAKQDRNFYQDMFHLKLSQKEKEVLEELHDFEHTSQGMAAMLDTSLNGARVFMTRLRHKLDGTAWEIATNKGGGRTSGVYRLKVRV